jgi:integrase
LLILTGARRDEIANARAEWLDLDQGTLTIPKASMKTRAGPHVIYLTPLMRDVLAECRAMPGANFLFTLHGRVPFGDWARSKRQLDKLSGVSGWRQHDLRRTAKTGWQGLRDRDGKLAILYEVRQMMSGHAVAGVVGVYERFDWPKECRAGFEAWSKHVRNLVVPPPENVVYPAFG